MTQGRSPEPARKHVGDLPQQRRDRRVVRAVGFVPFESKLQEPSSRDGLVFRGELVDRLRESAEDPIVLVTAPPGYGKTTLLRQWAEEDPRPFAWLSLDEADNDPAVLVTYLLLALQRTEPVDAGTLASLTDGDLPAGTVMLPRLGRMLQHRTMPTVVVLDDAHAVSAPDALGVIDALAHYLPSGFQLAVVARRAPNLAWQDLRLNGRLLELEAEDLKLTTVESRELLEATGVELDVADASALADATEGWPAGLHLAANSLKTAAARRLSVTGFTGGDSAVASYLHDHVLAPLSDDEQTWLTRVSLADEMNGPLCDAMLATTGSGARLRELSRANAFVVPLDQQDNWYRFHRSFREMLRAEHQRREPQLTGDLHSRAGRWLEANGRPGQAIAHAHAAGEIDRAGKLVWADAARLLSSDHRPVLEQRIQVFTSEEVVSRTHLALAAAWLAVGRGRPVEHWVSAAERGSYDATSPGEVEKVTAAIAMLKATLGMHGVTHMGADARVAAHLQKPDDPWRCIATYLDAVSNHLTDKRDRAAVLLDETHRVAATLHLPAAGALAKAQLAFLALEEHDWSSCAVLVDDAVDLVRQSGLADVPTMGMIWSVSTLMLARRGKLDDAKREARRTLTMLALTAHVAPWNAVQARYILARAHLILGDTAAARTVLSEAERYFPTTADAVVLRACLDEAWDMLEQSPLGYGGGLSTLTTAELRVLQYLPTHLSFEQISQRLFVSRNTVKTQAIAGYRKLGVTSRAKAVERAHALGLLQD